MFTDAGKLIHFHVDYVVKLNLAMQGCDELIIAISDLAMFYQPTFMCSFI